MIGMTAIRVKRGIQWDRAQIMVQEGSRLFFYSYGVQILNRKKCVVILQPKCRR
jgi:hypothetical protein